MTRTRHNRSMRKNTTDIQRAWWGIVEAWDGLMGAFVALAHTVWASLKEK